MKRAIINFANGRYEIGQNRLKQSLVRHGYHDAFFGWTSESQIGSPSHKANPYAFKTHAFQKVFDMGYDQVIWLDASVVAVADITPAWDKITDEGYIMQEAGHMVGTWCNDNALSYFDLNRDDAMNMLMYGNAGFLGLSKDSEIAMEFFRRWHEASKVGTFIGSWNNNGNTESSDARCKGHRHDMAVGSIIANQLQMNYESGAKWLHYAPPTQQPAEDVIFHAQGV